MLETGARTPRSRVKQTESPEPEAPRQSQADVPGFAQLVDGAADVQVDMARLSALMRLLDERLENVKHSADREAKMGLAKLRKGTGRGKPGNARKRVEALMRGVREAQKEIEKLSAEKIDVSRQLYDNLDRFIREMDRRFTLIRSRRPQQSPPDGPVDQDPKCDTQLESTRETTKRARTDDSAIQGPLPVNNLVAQGNLNTVEPTYCICGCGYYGLMVCCDSPNCRIGWYHIGCLGIEEARVKELPSKWLCPACSHQEAIGGGTMTVVEGYT